MALTKQFMWQHEDGEDRVLTMPVEPALFEANDTIDINRNFTNSGYVENNIFASYVIVELIFNFMTKENFFRNSPHLSLHASIQHFYQYIKKGNTFGFTWDYNKKLETELTAAPQVGSIYISVEDPLTVGDYVYITNSRGDHEVFWVKAGGTTAQVNPTISLQYATGDKVRSWPYFPALTYLGGSLNESWDSTKLYYTFSLRARTIEIL